MGVHDDDYNDEEELEEEDEDLEEEKEDLDEDASDDLDDDDSDDDNDGDDDDDDDGEESSSSKAASDVIDFELDDEESSAPEPETRSQIELADLRRLAASGSPEFAAALLEFWELPDPPQTGKMPEGAIGANEIQYKLNQIRWKPAAERPQLAKALWKKFLQNKEWPPPPRYAISDLLVELYKQNTESNRAALLYIIKHANLMMGLWGGLKRVYKLSEERLDAEMFGALAWRFDTEFMSAPRRRGYYGGSSYRQRNVTQGTMVYLKRRAWRFLKNLGRQVPELYPQFASQVLRHYGEETNWHQSWVGNHILAHESKKYGPYGFYYNVEESKELLKVRAYEDAWKKSAEPLMLLLEAAESDPVIKFAIQSLRKDFPEALRGATANWLERLARKPLGSAHDFLVETLKSTPEFHQAKLKGLGLHEAVLLLLESPSDKAREYAVEYTRANGQDLENDRLAKLAQSEHKKTSDLAVEILESRAPKKLGYQFLGKLLAIEATAKFAKKSLNDAFDRKEIPNDFLSEMIYSSEEQREWVGSYLKAKYQPGEITADFWKKIIDDERRKTSSDSYSAVEYAMEELGKFPVSSIGGDWLLDALMRSDLEHTVQRWLKKADSLPGLNLEKLKGLALHRKYRQTALDLLGTTKLIKPRDIGLPWLLAIARKADQQLNQWASKYLLENLKPADFSEKGDKEEGIAKLFSLATGEKEPEAVRVFAQTYLKCQHPEVSKDQKEAKEFGIKPHLSGKNIYTADRIWSFLFDTRPDVRKFAADITKAELRHWGYQTRVYELADSDAKEVRNIAFNALLKAGNAKADLACTLKPEEFEANKIFALTESRKRAARAAGMEVIRLHYAQLGGPEKLAQLMESADREVRMFAVRLLWERHRPTALPITWKPQKGEGFVRSDGRFDDTAALQGFLRQVLYGLPPGRSMESDDSGASRRLPASVAKKNVIAVVRDLALHDESFAKVVLPLFEEFSGSLAKGEWEACLAAVVQVRSAHKGLRA